MFLSGSNEWQGAHAPKTRWPRPASPSSPNAGESTNNAEYAATIALTSEFMTHLHEMSSASDDVYGERDDPEHQHEDDKQPNDSHACHHRSHVLHHGHAPFMRASGA